MARMIKTKFGYVSRTEAKCLDDLDRWLKKKKYRDRKTERKVGHDVKKL